MTWIGSGSWMPAFWHTRNFCVISTPPQELKEVCGEFDKLFDAIVKAETEAFEAGRKEGRSER